MGLPDSFQKHLQFLPGFNRDKVVQFSNEWILRGPVPVPPTPNVLPASTLPGCPPQNEFVAGMENDINRLILQCWDGHKLKDEDRRMFRKWVRYNKGQWIFITLLNQFRIKNVHSMTSDQAYNSISELLRIVLDEIQAAADTYVAVNCLLLSSTFYYNPASIGGNNTKRFLYELIADHKIWQDNNFWENAITQQIQKDLTSHQQLQANEADSGDSWGQLPAEERVTRVNEVVFAILSSLQQEMLTYNLDKSMIRSLVKKICSNMTSFPDNYLQSMLQKIEEHKQIPFAQNAQTTAQAKQYLAEPAKDPLYFQNDRQEEYKSMRSPLTAHQVTLNANSSAPQKQQIYAPVQQPLAQASANEVGGGGEEITSPRGNDESQQQEEDQERVNEDQFINDEQTQEIVEQTYEAPQSTFELVDSSEQQSLPNEMEQSEAQQE